MTFFLSPFSESIHFSQDAEHILPGGWSEDSLFSREIKVYLFCKICQLLLGLSVVLPGATEDNVFLIIGLNKKSLPYPSPAING